MSALAFAARLSVLALAACQNEPRACQFSCRSAADCERDHACRAGYCVRADSDLVCVEEEGGVAPVADACAGPPLPLGDFVGELAWFDECGLPGAGPLAVWPARGTATRSLTAFSGSGGQPAPYAAGSPRYVELDHGWLSIDLNGYLDPPPGGEAVFVVVGRFPPPEPPATSCVLALAGLRLQFRIDRPELELANADERLVTELVRDRDVHVFALILAPFGDGYRASVLVDGVGRREGLLGPIAPERQATIASCTGVRSEVRASILGALFMSGVGGRQLALDVMNHWLMRRLSYQLPALDPIDAGPGTSTTSSSVRAASSEADVGEQILRLGYTQPVP